MFGSYEPISMSNHKSTETTGIEITKPILFGFVSPLLSRGGKMIICHFMNITIRLLGGVAILGMFTTIRSHGYVNMTTWLGISQFF